MLVVELARVNIPREKRKSQLRKVMVPLRVPSGAGPNLSHKKTEYWFKLDRGALDPPKQYAIISKLI